MDFDVFLQLMKALEAEHADYVLVGAAALGVHGLVRATEDIDLFVRANPENVDRLKRALNAVWSDPEIENISSDDLAGEYPTVRYVPPTGGIVVDLISHLGEAFAFDDLEIEDVVLEGQRIRVASPRTLYRMKRDTLRPKDRMDAEALRRRFGLEEH